MGWLPIIFGSGMRKRCTKLHNVVLWFMCYLTVIDCSCAVISRVLWVGDMILARGHTVPIFSARFKNDNNKSENGSQNCTYLSSICYFAYKIVVLWASTTRTPQPRVFHLLATPISRALTFFHVACQCSL